MALAFGLISFRLCRWEGSNLGLAFFSSFRSKHVQETALSPGPHEQPVNCKRLRTAKAACCLVFLAVQQVLQLGLCLPHQRAEAIERPLASDLIQIGSEMNTIFNNLNITSPELEKQSKPQRCGSSHCLV